jgi:hypothetical protein
MGQDTLIEKENMLQNNGGFCSRERWPLYSYIREINSKIYYTNGQHEFLDTAVYLFLFFIISISRRGDIILYCYPNKKHVICLEIKDLTIVMLNQITAV